MAMFASERTGRTQEALALLILRWGLAWFLLVWAVNKFLAPDHYIRLWNSVHGWKIDETIVYYLAAVQVVICVAIMLGALRIVSYAAGLAMHLVSNWAVLPRLLDPFVIKDGFPSNRNLAINVAALAAFVALWLLRHRDHWSVDAVWKAMRRNRR